MVIKVSHHAINRYKQRIIKKKTTSGKKCAEKIKKALRNPIKVEQYRDIFCYHTNDFVARVSRSGCVLYVITVMGKDEKERWYNDRKIVSSF